MFQCQSLTQKGDQCKRLISQESLFCSQHLGTEYKRTALTPRRTRKKKITPPTPGKVLSEPGVPLFKASEPCQIRSQVPLRPHQLKVVEFMDTHRGLIVSFSVGSGKTLTAIAVAQCYLDSNSQGRVLVVTPTSLIDNFKKEMELYGISPKDPRFSFYTLQKFSNDIHSGKLICNPNDLLIIDEAHNLRTKITQKDIDENVNKRSLSAIQCAIRTSKVLLLTGTVLYNDPYDILNLVSMIKRKFYDEEFFNKLMSNRRLLESFLKDVIIVHEEPRNENYPEVREEDIYLVMDPDYYQNYKDIEKGLLQLEGFEGDPFRFLQGLRMATNKIDDSQKAEWVVDKILEGQKTIVFSNYINYGIGVIEERLKELGIPYYEITGSLTQKERKTIVNDFNQNKVKVLFLTKAGGEGLDLKEVRNVILLEGTWNQAQREQVIGRAVRYRSHAGLPEEERYVNVYNLYLIKPEEADGTLKKGQYPSADSILKKITEEKIVKNENFFSILRELSI